MKRLWTLMVAALAGVGSALTYYYFEHAVRHAITFIWDDMFDTGTHRLMLVPVCLVLTLVYFGVQHLLDPKAEKKESHGLGAAPAPTILNFIKILLIGFLSLVAGASLGPEAVLVPACVLLGSYLGTKLIDPRKQTAQLVGIAGFVGLFTAFFNSFIVGVLSILLIKKEFKLELNRDLVLLAAVASGGSVLTLGALESSAFVQTPHYSWNLDTRNLLMLAVLSIAGYGVTYGLGAAHRIGKRIIGSAAGKAWWVHGLAAGAGLSLLYLVGGSLVQFTGNESVIPLFKQAADLGFWGLVWIAVVKIAAIGWSKAAGYRGGLIFPTAFVASVLVAIAQLYVHDINLIYGLIGVMGGALYADSKAKILL